MESKNQSPLVTDQMESSLALDFADMAPKNGDFGEQSPSIRMSLRVGLTKGECMENILHNSNLCAYVSKNQR